LANHIIDMDTFPGVCPIGIGDNWRRLVAKCVLTGAGHSATTTCGSDQLCAGLRAGTDGAGEVPLEPIFLKHATEVRDTSR
jgi:hypothetical protein